VSSAGDLFLAGGWDGGAPLASVEVLDAATRTWSPGPPLAEATCFAAASFAPWAARHTLLLVGGGDTLWVGSVATDACSVLADAYDVAAAWKPGPRLVEARCGHGVAVLPDGVVAVGGYAGGEEYLASVERLGPDGSWRLLRPMRRARTGAGVGAGPDGCVYAAGGSPDGSGALRGAERYDPRTRAWARLPSMRARRGYVAAAFDASGDFLVHGGYDAVGDVQSSAEIFDVRAHAWRDAPLVPAAPDFDGGRGQKREQGPDSDVVGSGDPAEYLTRAQHALCLTLL